MYVKVQVYSEPLTSKSHLLGVKSLFVFLMIGFSQFSVIGRFDDLT